MKIIFVTLTLVGLLIATFTIQAQVVPAKVDGQFNSSFRLDFGGNEQYALQINKIVGLTENYSYELPISTAGSNIQIFYQDKKNYIYLYEHKKTQVNGYSTTYIISEHNHQFKLQLKATQKFPTNGAPYFENNDEWEELVPGQDRIIGSNVVGPCTTGGSDSRGRFIRSLAAGDTLTSFKEKFYNVYVHSEEFFIILCSKDLEEHYSQENIGKLDESKFNELKNKGFGIVRRRYQL